MKQYSLYDTDALYMQNMSDAAQDGFKAYYQRIFASCPGGAVHDCSVGAGGTTLPLALLGYKVSGSDLNENLLAKAKEHFAGAGVEVPLFLCDFRQIDKALPAPVDILLSTGNSLPHVDAAGFEQFVKAAHRSIKDGGLLYFDIRNWDKLAEERPLFKASDPFVMTAERHESLYLVFDWHDDDSVQFVFVTSTDENGKHAGEYATVAPDYYPLCRKTMESVLSENGFEDVEYASADHLFLGKEEMPIDFMRTEWYGVLAKKV